MTPTTSSSASSPNGETDMNDIDSPFDRYDDSFRARLWRATSVQDWSDGEMLWDLVVDARAEIATMFDAIETGRQWETIARRLLSGEISLEFAFAAFRALADRTPTPTDGT